MTSGNKMKDEQHVRNLLKQGVNEQLEFVSEILNDDISKSICAFLNTNGGTVLIGVQSDGNVLGLKDAEKQESLLKHYLFKSIVPVAPITVSIETSGSRTILLAKVLKGSSPPYLYEGIIYSRKGNRTVKAVPDDISKLISERGKLETHWERQPATGIKQNDLDEWEIRKTIKDLSSYGRGKEFGESEIEEFLTYYGLSQNNKLTNAAVVLFAREPSRFLPQCRIRLTVFKGNKSSDDIQYDRIFEGNLFRNIDAILLFFDVNIVAGSRFFDQKWLREDIAFPKSALREGIMNALIHRDYSDVSGSVMIAFYPDRLEITNSGELYGGYTPSDFSRSHLSVPRNPDIAHICFIRQMIEKIGRGTVKMIEDCENKAYPKPKWLSKSGVTTLTFPEVTLTAMTDRLKVESTTQDVVNKLIVEEITETVKLRLVSILHFILLHKKPKVSELMKEFNVSERTIKTNLKRLMDAGLVVYTGSKKAGGYIVKDPSSN